MARLTSDTALVRKSGQTQTTKGRKISAPSKLERCDENGHGTQKPVTCAAASASARYHPEPRSSLVSARINPNPRPTDDHTSCASSYRQLEDRFSLKVILLYFFSDYLCQENLISNVHRTLQTLCGLAYFEKNIKFLNWHKSACRSGAPQASYDKRRHQDCFQTRSLQAFPKKETSVEVRGRLMQLNSHTFSTTSIYMLSVTDFDPKETISGIRVHAGAKFGHTGCMVDRQMQSEFTPELHRWISKLTARHLQILHREIFWSPW